MAMAMAMGQSRILPSHRKCFTLFRYYVLGVLLAAVGPGVRGDNTASYPQVRRGGQSTSSSREQEEPMPTPFPDAFEIDFVTNITWNSEQERRRRRYDSDDEVSPQYSDLGNIHNLSTSSWISGRLYYDWTKKMQRIDHGPGSYECVHFYHYDGPCSLIFLPDWGMYRILHPKEKSPIPSKSTTTPSFDCCLDIPNIGTPPPNWAKKGIPTYNGIVEDSFSNLTAHEWIYDHVDPNAFRSFANHQSPQYNREVATLQDTPAEHYHTTRQVVDGEFAGRPLLFTFPSAGGTQDYHYLVDSLQEVDTVDPINFALPDGCQTQFCKCDHGENDHLSESRSL